MAKDKSQNEAQSTLTDVAAQNLQIAQKATSDYFQFWRRLMTNTPWGNSELTKKMAEAAQQNMAKNFDFAQQLARAKDPAEALRIQTEFFQAQLQSLNEQAKDLGDAVANLVKDKKGSE